MKRLFILDSIIVIAFVGSCSESRTTVPGTPRALEVNSGDGAISLGWSTPVSDGGSFIQSYSVDISPQDSATVAVVGTAAIITGLTNGTAYTLSVTAHNAVGQGPVSAAVQATPSTPNIATYAAIEVTGDTSQSGIFDPSVLLTSSADVWMAYSGVDYYRYPTASDPLVQDVSTKLAHSPDGGNSFSYVTTLGTAGPPSATVSVHDASQSICGAATCAGRWAYETPWLIDDSTDPDPGRRFKIFAHKYFLYPPHSPATIYVLGAIVMWTAPVLDGNWSSEEMVIGWNLTPPELPFPARNNINTLDPALQHCLLVAEGAASVRQEELDFVFACTLDSGGPPLPQKIVLLRSLDHANSFQYVATLLQPSDAPAGSAYYTAPGLIPSSSTAPVLIATPTTSAGVYAGCSVFPFADEESGSLFRDNDGLPISILEVPRINDTTHVGGACAWDRGLDATGILLNDVDLSVSPVQFKILATKKSL